MTTVIPGIFKELIRKGALGWVNEPGSGHAVLVERGTGCLIRDGRNQKITGPKTPYRQAGRLDSQAFYDHAKSPAIENDIDWMYQDNEGHVTVSIGHKLPTVEDALEMRDSFEDDNDLSRPITDDEIRAEYALVKEAEPPEDSTHRHFEPLTVLRLKTMASFEIFHDDVDRIFGELTAHSEYSRDKFETFPPDAKFAIMDMAFNMGAAGLTDGYPLFTGAVRNRNWALAAIESDRPTLSPARNREIRERLEKAAKLEPFFIDPNCRKSKLRL